jgi:hypothetical protein
MYICVKKSFFQNRLKKGGIINFLTAEIKHNLEMPVFFSFWHVLLLFEFKLRFQGELLCERCVQLLNV